MRICPKCSSYDIHRSRARRGWEALRRKLTSKRPYRCHTCGLRVWDVDIGPGAGEFELSDALNADRPTIRENPKPMREWPSDLDLDLEKLDVPRRDH